MNPQSAIRNPQSEPLAALWLRRMVIASGAAALWVLPQFSIWPSFYGNPGWPGPLAAVVVGLVLVMMPILVVLGWVAEGRAVVRRPLLAVPVALFVVGAVISTYYAADKSSALVRAAEMAGLWLAMLALGQAVRTDGERRFLLAALAASALVLAAGAIYQAAVVLPQTWQYFQAHRAEVMAAHGIEPGSLHERMYIGRFSGGVQGAMAHPNILATFLVMGILVTAGLVREKWAEAATRGARALAVAMAAIAAVCAAGLVLTQGRAAEAALVAGLYWLIVSWRARRRAWRLALYAATPVAAAAGLAVAIYVVQPVAGAALGVVQRVAGLEPMPTGAKDAGTGSATGGAIQSLRYRGEYWQATWPILESHALAGVGLSNFGLYYLEHKLPQAPEEIRDPHNMLLAMWSELGAAGLAAIVALLALAARETRNAHRGTRNGSDNGGAGGGLAAGLAQRVVRQAEDSRFAGRPRQVKKGEGAADAVARGEPMGGLLGLAFAAASVAMIAAAAAASGPAAMYLGATIGLVAVGIMATMTGLGAAEEPSRLEASGRPHASLRAASIAAVAAFVLQEQMGTAIMDPAAAWAMLVLVVVSMGGASTRNAELGTRNEDQEDGKKTAESTPQHDSKRAETIRQGTAAGGVAGTGGPAEGLALGAPAKFVLVAIAMGLAFLYVTRVIVPVGREKTLMAIAWQLSDPEERDEALRRAAEANPLAWEPAMVRAEVWRAQAGAAEGPEAAMDLEKAMGAYREALARQPRLMRAERGLAECRLALPGALEDTAGLADARTHLEAALRFYPTDVLGTLRLADVLDRLGDDAAALAAIQRAMWLDDQLPRPARRLTTDVRRGAEARAIAIRESVAAGGKKP